MLPQRDDSIHYLNREDIANRFKTRTVKFRIGSHIFLYLTKLISFDRPWQRSNI